MWQVGGLSAYACLLWILANQCNNDSSLFYFLYNAPMQFESQQYSDYIVYADACNGTHENYGLKLYPNP